jgi:hypothetical protein
MQNISYCYLILSKTGMGHQILVELPNIEFNEPCSIILKLFQAFGWMGGRMDIQQL